MIPAVELKDPTPADPLLDGMAAQAAALGFEIVDIAGFLERVDKLSASQLEQLKDARRAAREVTSANATVHEATSTVSASADAAMAEVEASLRRIKDSSGRTTEVAAWVSQLSERLRDVEETLKAVESSNREISSIASQVNILAINAKIEASRAGDAGRGFAVVAEAINALSRKTATAADGIAESIRRLSDWSTSLGHEAGSVKTDAEAVLAGAGDTDDALSRIADGVRKAQEGTRRIAEAAERSEAAVTAFKPVFGSMASAIEACASAVHDASVRTDSLIDLSERMVQGTVAAGGSSGDARFIDRVQSDAARIAALLDDALDQRVISYGDLFCEDYRPVEGTDPVQVVTPFSRLTDTLFPPIQEAALTLDPRIVFCAAVDRNGYLPTHNLKFSQPQGADPVWNAANSRNRRIFDDRVGLKAGRNTAPFLLQVYRRDMGGGEFRMMKDVSAPITVKGRHWGGLRLAYTF